jgi:hypothetical protein
MNERIQQLAEEAMGTRKYVPPVWQFYDHELEKFVELIKQSIYNKVKEELIPDDVIAEENPQFQEYLKGCNGGTVDALCHIKKFGVDGSLDD